MVLRLGGVNSDVEEQLEDDGIPIFWPKVVAAYA